VGRWRRLTCLVALTAGLASPVSSETSSRRSSAVLLHGKRVVVEYGSVALHGRSLDELLASLPDERVWRAGADEVSTLTTAIDLSVNSLCGSSCSKLRRPGRVRTIPAGSYTLYVAMPREGAWSLILNTDPGIELGELGRLLGFAVAPADTSRLWPHLEGYNGSFPIPGIARTELARVVMRPGSVEPPAEEFTMRLEPSQPGTLTLTLAWGDRSWSMDLNVDREAGRSGEGN